MPLSELVELKSGKALTKSELEDGPYPVVGGGTTPIGYHNQFNREERSILISQVGTAG